MCCLHNIIIFILSNLKRINLICFAEMDTCVVCNLSEIIFADSFITTIPTFEIFVIIIIIIIIIAIVMIIKGIGDAGSTADIRMLWSAMVCLGLL